MSAPRDLAAEAKTYDCGGTHGRHSQECHLIQALAAELERVKGERERGARLTPEDSVNIAALYYDTGKMDLDAAALALIGCGYAIDMAQQKCDRLAAELERARQEWDAAEKRRGGVAETLHTVVERVDKLRALLKERDRSIDALRDALVAKGRELERVKEERDELRKDRPALAEEMAHFARKNAGPANEATLAMTVARLGGTVEGAPTARHNFLQRVDELREIENERDALRDALAAKERECEAANETISAQDRAAIEWRDTVMTLTREHEEARKLMRRVVESEVLRATLKANTQDAALYDSIDAFLREKDGEVKTLTLAGIEEAKIALAMFPECAVDFCDQCGDCLHCYGTDPCTVHGDDEAHVWTTANERREAIARRARGEE